MMIKRIFSHEGLHRDQEGGWDSIIGTGFNLPSEITEKEEKKPDKIHETMVLKTLDIRQE